MRPIEHLLAKLPSARKSGNGWVARCPAHDDRRPSLSLTEGHDGRVLIRCFAGCDVKAICHALGIAVSELFSGNRDMRANRDPESRIARQVSFPTARRAVEALERRLGTRTGTWTYRDRNSNPIGLVARWDHPNGKQYRPISLIDGRWILAGMPPLRPLYRLPELIDANRVWIAEGEKAADVARSEGLVATTSAHGSRSAEKTDWSPLAGKECILLPDNDTAGFAYVEEVATILARLRPCPAIKIIDLPGLKTGEDIADYVAAARANQ